jgi:hypothetical protein
MGPECADIRKLEGFGLMKVTSAGRDPVTKHWFRRSLITDAGRVALAATQQ